MLGSNNVINVKRKTEVNGKRSYPASFYIEGVCCYIERASAEIVSMFGDIPAYKQFLVICEGVYDIKVHDLIIDSNGREFTVFADQTFDGNNEVPNHTEFLMQLEYRND